MSASGGASEAISVVLIGNPAAGADWTYTAPNTVELLAVGATLVTSAAVANRVPRLRFLDNAAHQLTTAPLQSNLVASTTAFCSWYPGATSNGLGGAAVQSMPGGIWLPAGFVVNVSTANIDVADQWSNIALTLINR